jgi:carbon-monoxide dehydrogenase small subunit
MKARVSLKVNGEDVQREIDTRMLLVDFIRRELKLTGTHVGCDTSSCGACAVLLDGRAVKSCTVLAVQANGREVVTIEGFSSATIHPIQRAFVEKQGLQCGFCTPGMIISAYQLLSEKQNPTEEDIRRALSGNICRCTGYTTIIESVKYASKLIRGKKK